MALRSPSRRRALPLVALAALLGVAGGCRLFLDLDGITGDGPGPDGGTDTSSAERDAANESGADVASETSVDAGDGGSPVSLDGCVLLMHMEEPAFVAGVSDSSGSHNDGQAVGTMQSDPNGRIGRAASFDGASWIDIASSASLGVTTKLTYAAWIKPTGNLDGALSPGIIAKRDGFDTNVAFTMFLYANDNLYVDVPGTVRNHSTTMFTLGSWAHVATVYDGTAAAPTRIRIYVNGKLDQSFTDSVGSIPITSAHLLIGNLVNGGDRFKGLIDEVAIWSRALSDAEIAALAAATVPLR